jgi:hypothetical protein
MGKTVQVNDGKNALLPDDWGHRLYTSGQTTTLTDAEYAGLPALVSALITVTGTATDPVRPPGTDVESLDAAYLATAKAYADAVVAGRAPLASPAFTGVASFVSAKGGGAPQTAYTFEYGEDEDGLNADKSFVRIRTRTSRGTNTPSSFFGKTALRIEIEDTTSVTTDGTMPYHYGVRVRAVPRRGRHQTGVDDMVGVCVVNRSFNDTGTAFNGTEAVYVGWGGGSTGGASKDWNAGVGIDTVADNGMYIVRGPYAYGILMTASFTTAAMRIPNASQVVGRKADDSGNVNAWRIDTANHVRLGATGTPVIVGDPNADAGPTQALEIHSTGAADGTVLTRSHLRICDTTAWAKDIGPGVGFAGYVDATPTLRTFGAIKGGKANVTGGNSAGYLAFMSRAAATGLLEVFRITETQTLQFAEVADFTFGTTTGSKIGTAASQKLALWGVAPIVQPTTAVAAATFVVGSGTAVNDASTFDGYTIKQAIKALRNLGALA